MFRLEIWRIIILYYCGDIIYGIFFENKTQTQMAEIMGISRQMLSYKLKSTLNKMREMYMNKFF